MFVGKNVADAADQKNFQRISLECPNSRAHLCVSTQKNERGQKKERGNVN